MGTSWKHVPVIVDSPDKGAKLTQIGRRQQVQNCLNFFFVGLMPVGVIQ